ncbi:MAG: hypothetical protein JJU00_00805 [Opitutales bacterium]|nr:hypothetical protein [Opitutales bacterium]
MMTAAPLAGAMISSAAAETAYLHNTTVLPRGPFADDGLDAVRFAEGAFRLLSDGAAYRSLNGAEWTPDPKGHRYFAGTRVGPLWFAEEDGVVFTSEDRISWRRIPAPGIPDAYGDGTFALLKNDDSAEGGRVFAFADENSLQSWESHAANLGADARLLDRIGGRWVAVEGTEMKASTDGAAWETVDPAPDEAGRVAPLASVQPTAGSGHVLIFMSYGTYFGPQEHVALHSDDLETWRVIEPFGLTPGGFPGVLWIWDPRIRRWDDGFHVVGRYAQMVITDWRYGFDYLLHTTDFEVFSTAPTGSLSVNPERFTVAFPRSAAGIVDGQSVQLDLLSESYGNETSTASALQRTVDGQSETINLGRPDPSRFFLTSFGMLGDISFAATARTVYTVSGGGSSWETSLAADTGWMSFDRSRLGIPAVTGFFSITEAYDRMWAATRDNGDGNAAVWEYSPSADEWSVVREMPPEACRFFARVGEHLVVAGVHEGKTIIEWTTDGETWESHSFPETMPIIRVRRIDGEFYLVGSEFRDGEPFGRLMRSQDLRNWETLLTSEDTGIAFRDVARVNGTWIVTRAYSNNPDYEIDRSVFGAANEFLTSPDGSEWTLRSERGLHGILTALPDGSAVDSGGLRTWDGIHWVRGHDLVHPRSEADVDLFFAFAVQDDDTVVRTVQRRETSFGQSSETIYSFDFNAIDRFVPAAERTWTFSPHEGAALDHAADTVWGTFHPVGGRWYRHDGFGYVYAPENRLGSYWYWSPEDGWLWIDHRLAHFFYAPAEDAWHFLFP